MLHGFGVKKFSGYYNKKVNTEINYKQNKQTLK